MSGWAALDRLLAEAAGDYSACVQFPDGQVIYQHAADRVCRAASLIKLPLAIALILSDRGRRQGETGVNLDEAIILREADRAQGDGAYQGAVDRASDGSQWTYWQLIDQTIRASDNTAANLLIAAIGFDEVNRLLRGAPFHLRATILRRRFMDFAAAKAGRENLTTAREMCILFAELYRLADQYGPLMSWLKASADDDKIVAGVPAETAVAHKTGDLPGIEHDAGIVYATGKPYIVALLAENLPDAAVGRQTIAAASRLIYEQMIT